MKLLEEAEGKKDKTAVEKIEKRLAEVERDGLEEQLELCVRWDRPDILEHAVTYKHRFLANTSPHFKTTVTNMVSVAVSLL